MKVAVIGHTGLCGRPLVAHLASRGHDVTGIARRLPVDVVPGCRSIAIDVFDVAALTGALAGHDVVVSTYSGGHGTDLSVYQRQIEGTRRIIRAVVAAAAGYLVYQGGAASLYVRPGVQMIDDERFPGWYFGVMPAAHLRWLAELAGLALLHEAADRRERGELRRGECDERLAQALAHWKSIPLLDGCRVALELFEARRDFAWSFLSPPWLLRPGRATGRYRLGVDFMPFDGDVPAGISVDDLALAVADEVDNRALVHRHWTASGPQDDA